MRYTIFAVLLIAVAALHSTVTAGELIIECPETIAAAESIADAYGSWQVQQDLGKRGKFLDSISVYSGHPLEMGNLVPDGSTRKKLKRTYRWELRSQSSERFWAVCTYTNSTLLLTRQLPESVRKCELTERLLPTGVKLGIESMRCEF